MKMNIFVTRSVYHAVADEGISFKRIAETIGRQLGLPVESRDKEHFGWFASSDMSASSEQTRNLVGWNPTGPNLLEDINQPDYCK